MITVNGDEFAWHEGMTVQDVLDLKHYPITTISIWVNGKAIRNRGEFSETLVPDESCIWIVQMMSGG
jgi:thiamine biosynthesis protein ThiS